MSNIFHALYFLNYDIVERNYFAHATNQQQQCECVWMLCKKWRYFTQAVVARDFFSQPDSKPLIELQQQL